MVDARIVTLGVAIASAAVGAGAGFMFAKKKYEAAWSEDAQKQIEDARNFYKTLYKKGDLETPEGAVKAHLGEEVAAKVAADALSEYQGNPINVVTRDRSILVSEDEEGDESEELEHTSEPTQGLILFNDVALKVEEWDLDAEQSNRASGRPYVITEAEWSENDLMHDRLVLTYFSGDDTLVDEDEDVIDDPDSLVGNDNLRRFGHGCDDANVVFIRNEARSTDYEVMRHTGSYVEEVLGISETEEKPARTNRRRVLDE